MITAVLADDEPIIIKGLKKLIPWEELGIRIVGEAWTGKGLMELIEREKPSLVITDISMPDGSGIDVLKEITSRGLRSKVLFISAYQEFSYAKDALALGAVDYLVKPIEKGLLLSAVDKAITLLKEESEGIQYKTKLAVYEHKDRKTQLEELFDRLLDGDVRMEEAEDKLRSLDSGCTYSHYTVMLLEPEQSGENSRWGEHEKRLLLFAIGNMAEELMCADAAGIILRKGERLCAVVNHHGNYAVQALAANIIHNVQLFLKITLSVGIGKTATGLEAIKESYRTACEAMGLVFFKGGRAHSWSDIQVKSEVSERDLSDARQQVFQALVTKERALVESRLFELLANIRDFSGGSRDKAVMACYSTLLEWSVGLEEIGIPLVEEGQELKSHLTVMHNANRYEELEQYLQDLTEGLLRRLESGGVGKEAQQLLTVKEYMERCYMDNITLEGAASKIFMNPYYFSTFFKKHTQMNFKQYLTEVRMKQAVKLLLQTDLMVYEIAEQVGDNNARQFSDMFKKYYGKLPQEYKMQSGDK
ncbi:response regulator [Paenibacillus hexagrammi]|uniref:Response regulator n=1 Tax=Paenibacillus hexagrammi TaxID=2908839 RepID=A0ABY3SE77_9BACL|nr:response regulator [Paenibacillus sp. YPD9-1]UJF31420.1 response regulator [Paenibacillus sp. YPD9-1]